MIVTIYDTSSGLIKRIVEAPSGLAQAQTNSGESWLTGRSNDLTQYVSGGLITDKPEMPGTLPASITTAETATITGPEGAQVTISGPVSGSDTLDADGIEISSNIPGTYTITVTMFPYLDKEYTLEITEP